MDASLRHPLTLADVTLLLVLIPIGVFSGSFRVALTSHKEGKNSASITLGFIIAIVSLFTSGPLVGIIVGCATMVQSVYKNKAFYRKIFNICAIIITCWTTYRFIILAGIINLDSMQLFTSHKIENILPSFFLTLVLLAGILTHHIVNSLLTTIAMALFAKWNLKKTYDFIVNSILWVIPTYLVAGCFIIMSTWVLFNLANGNFGVIPLCLVILPQPFLYLHNLRLHRERDEEREKRFQELESLYSSMVQAMGRAIEAKDRYTQEHIGRVVRMSLAIGQELGLSEKKLRTLEVGAALHDIGKIAIPDTVLNKPGKLTPEEFDLVKEHAALGSEILQPVPFPPEVVEAVRHHHEKWDGTGYPDRLVGESIPLVARIVAVADVYDALTSNRPYRAAWSHQKAISFMKSQVNTHFNAEIFAAFEIVMKENPAICSQAVDPEPVTFLRAA